MSRRNKELTAKIPQRLMNKTSIYLAKQLEVNREEFTGYEATVHLADGGYIIVRSKPEINPKDGRMFDYVLNQWQALLTKQKDLKSMEIDVVATVESLGQKNRTENRVKVIDSLKVIQSMSIIYNWCSDEGISFNLLDDVKQIDGTMICQHYIGHF